MPCAKFVLAVAAMLQCASAGLAQDAFATDNNNDLYRIDISAGTATLIGNTGVLLEDLATSPTGVIFGSDPSGNLWTVNPATAAATYIGPSFLGNIEALEFNGSQLLAVDFNPTPNVYRLSTKWGLSSWVTTAQSATGAVRSAALLDSEHLLVRGDLNGDTLFSLRLADGQVSELGAMSDTIYGMRFIDGTLYGASDLGEIYAIDPANGQLTLAADVGEQFFLGITRVPEPASAVLIAMLLLGRAARRA